MESKGHTDQGVSNLKQAGEKVNDAFNIAFVGGIDLCHGRRDDASHRGDPQTSRRRGVWDVVEVHEG